MEVLFVIGDNGQRRFSKPEPPSKWTGVRDASHFGNECLQRYVPEFILQVGEKPLDRREDCLYLNVYVPSDVKHGQPLAVMVWIHGGGYYLGAGSQFEGSELAATGVILVTINYRLDIFGFLSGEDDTIPGNFGMLDQVMALKWVKENILAFGGDPSKITIFGESAGSASVSLLILSPLASGLFNRAIMESGVSLCSWAITTPAVRMPPRKVLSLIGNEIGCMEYNVTKKLQCFRNVDAQRLLNSSVALEYTFPLRLLFAPRVENTFSFLPDLPISLLTRNKFNHVDIMRGYNTDESGPAILDDDNDGLSKEEFIKTLQDVLQPYTFTDRDIVMNEIVAAYLGNETNRNVIRYAAVRAASDIQFTGPTIIESDIQSKLAKENNHYLFEFAHKPSYTPVPSWMNAVHAEELPFVFGVNLPEFRLFNGARTPSKEDNVVWNQVKTMWSNFAKCGNPSQTVPDGSVTWTPYDTKNAKYLKIDTKSKVLSLSRTNARIIYTKILQRLQLQTNYPPDFIAG